jgi:hypothetical protein
MPEVLPSKFVLSELIGQIRRQLGRFTPSIPPYYMHETSNEPRESMFQEKSDRLQWYSESKPLHRATKTSELIRSTDRQSGSLDASHNLTHLCLRKNCSLPGNDELFFELISRHGAQIALFGLYHTQCVELFQSST